jgi:hypothetical protein
LAPWCSSGPTSWEFSASDVITRLNAGGDRLVIESWNPVRGYRVLERE